MITATPGIDREHLQRTGELSSFHYVEVIMNRRFFGGLLAAIFSTALCAGTLVNNSD